MRPLNIKICAILIIFINYSCVGGKKDPVTGKVEIIEPNSEKRARDYADKNPISLFGGKKDDNFKFSSSNALWRATLKSLDFIPLQSVDYGGGIIITDWYADKLNSKEQIKISIKFFREEIRSDSISVIAFKKICTNENNCLTNKMDEKFSQEIKESILNTARLLNIEDQKKK